MKVSMTIPKLRPKEFQPSFNGGGRLEKIKELKKQNKSMVFIVFVVSCFVVFIVFIVTNFPNFSNLAKFYSFCFLFFPEDLQKYLGIDSNWIAQQKNIGLSSCHQGILGGEMEVDSTVASSLRSTGCSRRKSWIKKSTNQPFWETFHRSPGRFLYNMFMCV